MISVHHPTNSVTDSINSMDKLETEARTYKNVTVLPFLLSEMASKNAAFLPKGMGHVRSV